MSGVNLVLSANTQQYVAKINEANKKSNTAFNNMAANADSFSKSVSAAFTSPGAAIQAFAGRLGPVGAALGVAGAAAVGAGIGLAAMGQQAAATSKQMQALATANGTSIESMNKMIVAAGTVGMSIEQIADIAKDSNEKIGEYFAAGSGGMVDYFEVIGTRIGQTKQDFEGLGAIEVLQKMKRDMDANRVSMQQQTFVLESMASEASKLAPILGASDQELQNMLKGYSDKRVQINQQTQQSINATLANVDLLQNNFNSVMVESFKSLIDLSNGIVSKASEMFSYLGLKGAEQNSVRSFNRDKQGVNAQNYVDFKNNEGALEKDVRDNFKAREDQRRRQEENAFNKKKGFSYGSSYQDPNQKFVFTPRKIEDDPQYQAFLENKNKATDYDGAAKRKAKMVSAPGTTTDTTIADFEAGTKQLDALAKQRTSILEEQKKLQVQAQNAGPEEKKVIEDQIKAYDEQLRGIEVSTKAANDSISKLQQEDGQKRLAARMTLAHTESERLQANYDSQINTLNQHLQAGYITEKEYAEKKLKLQKDLSLALTDVKRKQAEADDQIFRDAYDKDKSRDDLKMQFLTTEQQRNDLEADMKRKHLEELYRQDQSALGQKILTEQNLNSAMAAVEREHFEANFALKGEQYASENDMLLAKYQAEREMLEEQLASKQITQTEFDALSLTNKQNTAEAEKQIELSKLAVTEQAFGAVAGMLKEGSKAQRAALIASKSASLTSLAINQWDAWGRVNTGSYWGDIAAKAQIITSFGGAVASLGSVNVGQAHSGMDQIDSQGSYYLSAGERIVQPEANKKLTQFLDSNAAKGSGEGIVINSDLVIEGDTSISPEKFDSMLAKHRDSLLQFTNLARREQGM